MTLTELIVTMATFVILAGVAFTVYIAVLRSWLAQERRTGISIVLDRTIKDMTKDLREAKEVDSSINNDEIRFTEDQTNYYIYYLYNANETYPPVFNQATYELRKAALVGVIDGTFTYGDGLLILRDVAAPPTTDLSFDGSLVTTDLTVSRSGQVMRAKIEIDPRNL